MVIKGVLVLCTGHSCRFRIPDACWADPGYVDWQAESAGSEDEQPLVLGCVRGQRRDRIFWYLTSVEWTVFADLTKAN